MSAVRLGLGMLLSIALAGCATPVSPAPSGTIPSILVSPSAAASVPGPGVTGLPGVSPAPVITSSPARPPAPVPAFSHIYLIVLENKEASAIIGSAAAPYINRLAAAYGLATNYTAIGHPSEPNYIALASGSTNGVSDDGVHDLTAPSIFDQIDAAGRTWQVAAQNDRPGCFAGTTASGGEDGPGTYARKHNPAISFRSISRNPGTCARITDFKGFDPAGAAFSWIVPNMCNSMHDCPVATGDSWLASFLPRILASSAYRQGGLILLTFDEGSTSLGGGGKVATIVISPLARAGFVSATAHDHYSLLRTIQAAWGLSCLAHTCQANDLREFFR